MVKFTKIFCLVILILSKILAKYVVLLLIFFQSKNFSEDETEDSTADFVDFCSKWVLRVCKFMINNFDDFCVDVCASHLLRTAFQCAAGIKVEERQQKKGGGGQHPAKPTSGESEKKSYLHDDDERRNDFLSILSLAVEKVKEIENIKGKTLFLGCSGYCPKWGYGVVGW